MTQPPPSQPSDMYSPCEADQVVKQDALPVCGPATAPPSLPSGCSPVLVPAMPGYVGMPQEVPQVGTSVNDSVDVYLLSREQLRRCLECTLCHHQYLWPWHPLALHPAPPILTPAAAAAAATHLRFQLLSPDDDRASLSTWRRGFSVDSLLAPRDIWPLHLPPHLPPHIPTQPSLHTPSNGMITVV